MYPSCTCRPRVNKPRHKIKFVVVALNAPTLGKREQVERIKNREHPSGANEKPAIPPVAQTGGILRREAFIHRNQWKSSLAKGSRLAERSQRSISLSFSQAFRLKRTEYKELYYQTHSTE